MPGQMIDSDRNSVILLLSGFRRARQILYNRPVCDSAQVLARRAGPKRPEMA
jgi:hypothetical protein